MTSLSIPGAAFRKLAVHFPYPPRDLRLVWSAARPALLFAATALGATDRINDRIEVASIPAGRVGLASETLAKRPRSLRGRRRAKR
jgi:hypothetical protein